MSDIIRIENISSYIQEVIGDTLILKPKNKILTEEELSMTSLTKSKITSCSIVDNNDKVISKKKQYQPILTEIWKSMPSQKILQNTTFNFKLGDEKGEKGYNWNEKINMSYQGKDSNGSMREIIHMCKLNNYKIDISIKLENNKNINFKLE